MSSPQQSMNGTRNFQNLFKEGQKHLLFEILNFAFFAILLTFIIILYSNDKIKNKIEEDNETNKIVIASISLGGVTIAFFLFTVASEILNKNLTPQTRGRLYEFEVIIRFVTTVISAVSIGMLADRKEIKETIKEQGEDGYLWGGIAVISLIFIYIMFRIIHRFSYNKFGDWAGNSNFNFFSSNRTPAEPTPAEPTPQKVIPQKVIPQKVRDSGNVVTGFNVGSLGNTKTLYRKGPVDRGTLYNTPEEAEEEKHDAKTYSGSAAEEANRINNLSKFEAPF